MKWSWKSEGMMGLEIVIKNCGSVDAKRLGWEPKGIINNSGCCERNKYQSTQSASPLLYLEHDFPSAHA